MPTRNYEICVDEAWTHTSPPPNRYWCFFGGLLGSESDCDRLETSLRATVARHGLKGEVKWSAVTGINMVAYKELVDVLFAHIRKYDLRYRQTFLDRSYHHVGKAGDQELTPLDVQYRICYQFLKHCFGLKYLKGKSGEHFNVVIRVDQHSSQKHTAELKKFSEQLPETLGCDCITTTVQFVNSKKFLRLQLCDLLMGAAGSHGNKMHLKREAGRRGMSPKQVWRHEMAAYIYNKLKDLDHEERGSGAFNWFESTGTNGDVKNRFGHKLRIWKFIPDNYKRDLGWQNDHLDKQGVYQGPKLDKTIHKHTKEFEI